MKNSSENLPSILVLAGSRLGQEDPVALATGSACKAFAPVLGVPMLERVLTTLLSVPHRAPLFVSLPGGMPLSQAPGLARMIAMEQVRILKPEEGPSASVTAALENNPERLPLLLTTADHPLLTEAMVTQFLEASAQSGATVTAALAPIETVRKAYPRTRRTRLRFRDGGFSGCNLFYFANGEALAAISFWQSMEQHRKAPWRIAASLGVSTFCAYLAQLLTLDAVIARLSQRVGVKLAAIRLPIAEAAIDVDRMEDHALAEEILRARESQSAA